MVNDFLSPPAHPFRRYGYDSGTHSDAREALHTHTRGHAPRLPASATRGGRTAAALGADFSLQNLHLDKQAVPGRDDGSGRRVVTILAYLTDAETDGLEGGDHRPDQGRI